jgi:8-oxo-dGTP pyrophosphatase MutT (NUDIX family)
MVGGSWMQRWHYGVSRFLRPMTLGVRGVVLDDQGRVFLVRHTYVRGWYLPGGGVEVGETAACALKRELAEEGNILITGAPILHGLFLNPQTSRRDHVACYVVREFRQIAPHRPDWEIAEAGFFGRDQLPAETTPATRARLAEVLDGAPIAETW